MYLKLGRIGLCHMSLSINCNKETVLGLFRAFHLMDPNPMLNSSPCITEIKGDLMDLIDKIERSTICHMFLEQKKSHKGNIDDIFSF